ncbi:DUF5316 domain-containing protein [Sutcliffiella horikoshii]|uniref:DUF5316 family protein n=1 Tax=Sutcliffiella horikoshii TaxID=79883 RepID=UPI002041603F|nr:DUF5316 family protein [Sutcliffiella horikoshii]MCM3619868.1 DUF5316 domain-containing protein [Sutcliffiella horikoshii]
MIQLFLIVGIVAIGISGVFLGTWTSGEQHRENYRSDTKEQRDFNSKIGIYSGLIGLASLGVVGLLLYI